MKSLGWVVLVLGVIWALVAINMDVSVATGYGGRVNNIGLMASKQNQIIISAFIVLCGLLMVIFGRRKVEEVGLNVKCPFCAEFIKADAIKCKHCGSDVQPTFAEKEIKNFNPSEMESRSFYINRKDGPEVNRVSIGDLVNKLKDANPSMSNDDIEKKYRQQIIYLQCQVPKKIREDFLKIYKSILLES